MSEITTNAELPAISADPLQQTVDHGFPLYRFAETSRREFIECDLLDFIINWNFFSRH